MNRRDTETHTSDSAHVWNSSEIVSSFQRAAPSRSLLDFVRRFAGEGGRLNVLDIGCGAGRNTIPLAEDGHSVVGVDIAPAMIEAARETAKAREVSDRCSFLRGTMDTLPLRGGTAPFDVVVSHGVWNLACTESELRGALSEASRLARPGAALVVTTFSRNTLPPDVEPVPGTRYIYTQFNDTPQCFLRKEELIEELARAGFSPWPGRAIEELNRPGAWEQTQSFHRAGAGGAGAGESVPGAAGSGGARAGESVPGAADSATGASRSAPGTATGSGGSTGARGVRSIPLASPKRPVLYAGIWRRD